MQETAGAVRIDEGVCEFPDPLRSFTQPVRYYTYRVLRADWELKKPE
jgi:hypothetical protein